MTYSIRKFLVVNLLVWITIATTLTVIGNYILDQRDIERHLDSLLGQSGLVFQALIGSDFTKRDLIQTQEQLDQIPIIVHQMYRSGKNQNISLEDKFQFQVWDQQGNLLVHSVNAPLISLSNGQDGFSNIKIQGRTWRSLTITDADSHLKIIVAERFDSRVKLAHTIARDDIFIMLLIYPLLGCMIWITIGKGLSPLNKIAYEVSNRDRSNLSIVEPSAVPIEISALVDELNKLLARLQSAFEREKRFAADAAHELRTPLAALKSQAQLALKLKDPQERKAALDKLISIADRSTHIVQQLLTLSRTVPEEAYTLTDVSSFDMRRLTVDEITDVVPKAIEKKIEIELISPEHALALQGQMTSISILIRNLLDNAIRYSPPNSHIWVRLEEKKQAIVLQVADNGPGVPLAYRKRIFERFYRVLGNKAHGTGLGLAIVQQIADLHQATITLESTHPETDTGFCITIEFPKMRFNKKN
jgi:two-component system, OmpR family, sensor histidine kinase QseC